MSEAEIDQVGSIGEPLGAQTSHGVKTARLSSLTVWLRRTAISAAKVMLFCSCEPKPRTNPARILSSSTTCVPDSVVPSALMMMAWPSAVTMPPATS